LGDNHIMEVLFNEDYEGDFISESDPSEWRDSEELDLSKVLWSVTFQMKQHPEHCQVIVNLFHHLQSV
jgi:hypothetical protein